MIEFVSEFRKSTGYEDTHHIFKTQEAKKLGIDPNVRHNMIWIPREVHNALHSPSTDSKAKEIRVDMYGKVLRKFLEENTLNMFEFTCVSRLYKWCFIKGYNKKSNFYIEHYEDIIAGINIIIRISKEKNARG